MKGNAVIWLEEFKVCNMKQYLTPDLQSNIIWVVDVQNYLTPDADYFYLFDTWVVI